MTEHEVNVGASVFSRDGKRLGEIEQVMYLPDTGQIGGFLLGTGFFSAPKIIETEFIEHSNAQGVTLSITADEVDDLPAFVQKQLVRTVDTVILRGARGAPIGTASDKGPWAMSGAAGLPSTGATMLYLAPPPANLETMNISNLPEDVVLVSEETDVVGSDGKKIGQVDEVFVDDDQRVTGLLVKAGWFFRHDVTIPANVIAAITHKEVRLRVPAAEAQHASWEPADA